MKSLMEKHDRLTARDGALLVIDLQDRLIKTVEGRARLVTSVLRLVRGASILGVPSFATEQAPEKLGPSLPELAALISARAGKTTFHAFGAPGIAGSLASRYIQHVTLVGIEAHICVAQTALELIRLGYRVQVPADAVGSRFPLDRDVALRRMEVAGAIITTTEAVLFEWIEGADHEHFREISALVKERTASG